MRRLTRTPACSLLFILRYQGYHRFQMQKVFLVFGLIAICSNSARAASVFCSERLYGSPTYKDCVGALQYIDPSDSQGRLFVEQQLRAKPPQGDWKAISDPRVPAFRQSIAQIPKWWSNGRQD